MDTPSLSSSPSSSSPHSLTSSPSNSQSSSINPGAGNITNINGRQTVEILSILSPEILAHIASQINDPASLVSLMNTCTVFKTVVEEKIVREYNRFIKSDEPELPDNFYTQLKINKILKINENSRNITIPLPGTTEWKELKTNPLPIEPLQGEARQIALITNLYIKAWDLLLRPETLNHPQQASKLMKLLFDLLPHISKCNAINYANKLFDHGLSWKIFEHLAHIHLDRCLCLIIVYFKFNANGDQTCKLSDNSIIKQGVNLINSMGEIPEEGSEKDLTVFLNPKQELDSKQLAHSFLFLVAHSFSFSSEEKHAKGNTLLNMLFAYGYQSKQTDEEDKRVLNAVLEDALDTVYSLGIQDRISMTHFCSLMILLLNRGADPNVQTKKHETALIMACQYGLKDLIESLLKRNDINGNKRSTRGIDVESDNSHSRGIRNIVRRKGKSALEYLIEKNEFPIIQTLLQHSTMNENTLIAALHFSIQCDNLKAVQELLNCNKIERNTLLPIFNNMVKGRKEEIANTILKHMDDQFIHEAFTLALEKGQQDVAELLREKYGVTERPANKRGREEFESKTSP